MYSLTRSSGDQSLSLAGSGLSPQGMWLMQSSAATWLLPVAGGTYAAAIALASDASLREIGATNKSTGIPAVLSGAITGAGGLSKLGPGALTLSGNCTYAGDTLINDAALTLSSAVAGNSKRIRVTGSKGVSITRASAYNYAPGPGATLELPDGQALTLTNGGTLTANRTIQFGKTLSLYGSGTYTVDAALVAQNAAAAIWLRSALTLTITNAACNFGAGISATDNTGGTITFAMPANTRAPCAALSAGGGGLHNYGRLPAWRFNGGDNQLSPSAIWTAGAQRYGGTSSISLNGTNQTCGGLTDSDRATCPCGNPTIGNGHAAQVSTLTINVAAGASYSYGNSNAFWGGVNRSLVNGGAAALNIIKSGAGTQILTGNANTYTGTTEVAAGVLQFTATLAPSSQWIVDVANVAPTAANSGQLRVPGGTSLAAKTVDIKITEAGVGVNWVAVAPVSGAWTGAPTLKVNGNTVASGVATPGGTTVTYTSTGITVTR